MSLVALICPNCGKGLAPRTGQAIHACPDCNSSFEAIPDRGLIPVPRELVRPRMAPRGVSRLLLLPVWCIKVHRERLPEVAGRMAEEIRIPASGVARLPLLVAAARRLTRAAAPRESWPGVEAPVNTTEIDAETAFSIAESVALRHVNGWPKEPEVASVEIPLGGATLVDWPCVRDGAELVELVGGLSVPAALIEGTGARDLYPVLGPALIGMNLPEEYSPVRSSG